MPFFRPDWVLDTYSALSPELLRAQGVRLLLTDLDFTLAPKTQAEPDEEVRGWIERMQRSGVQVMILSNNRRSRRVERFCAELGIPYEGHARKPLPHGYRRAMQRAGAAREETAMLGDKLLTDLLGAHLSALPVFLVEPRGGAKTPWQKILHAAQEPFKRMALHDLRQNGKK